MKDGERGRLIPLERKNRKSGSTILYLTLTPYSREQGGRADERRKLLLVPDK